MNRQQPGISGSAATPFAPNLEAPCCTGMDDFGNCLCSYERQYKESDVRQYVECEVPWWVTGVKGSESEIFWASFPTAPTGEVA